jgi:hypothetical protein
MIISFYSISYQVQSALLFTYASRLNILLSIENILNVFKHVLWEKTHKKCYFQFVRHPLVISHFLLLRISFWVAFSNVPYLDNLPFRFISWLTWVSTYAFTRSCLPSFNYHSYSYAYTYSSYTARVYLLYLCFYTNTWAILLSYTHFIHICN